ncbi:MAG: class I SAM-dependent methyltransferase [Acidimicrobiales bacterium]
MDDDDLLEEQRTFYRARAPGYDEWWQRRGRYDRGPEHALEWDRQVAVAQDALDAFGPTGDVLELAGGTGWWTQRLAGSADHLTVVDSSPEVLEINRQRVAREGVTYVVADLFEWRPKRAFDVVFFSFWLSHVPRRAPLTPRDRGLERRHRRDSMVHVRSSAAALGTGCYPFSPLAHNVGSPEEVDSVLVGAEQAGGQNGHRGGSIPRAQRTRGGNRRQSRGLLVADPLGPPGGSLWLTRCALKA